MIRTTVAAARAHLPDLIDAAFRGEEVMIVVESDGSEREIQLVAISSQPDVAINREFGIAKGLAWTWDDFDKPLEHIEEHAT